MSVRIWRFLPLTLFAPSFPHGSPRDAVLQDVTCFPFRGTPSGWRSRPLFWTPGGLAAGLGGGDERLQEGPFLVG